MRDKLSSLLVKFAESNDKFLVLTGDHGYALFDKLRHKHPCKFINAGISEQNMVGMSAGLAKIGFKPIVYGLSAFLAIRALEQIKVDVVHDNLPVVFLGDGAGLVYSYLGTSHMCTEDIAALRAIPNLTILSPCDVHEMEACFEYAMSNLGPTYVRIGKSDKPLVHDSNLYPESVTKLISVKKSTALKPISILSTGSMVSTAVEVNEKYLPDSCVWSVPCLKPIDLQSIHEISRESTLIVTIEEHSLMGGLGSIVSEVCGDNAPNNILSIGVEDSFVGVCGSYEYLMKYQQLDPFSIYSRIIERLDKIKI